MQNKNALIGAVVALIIVGVGGYFIFGNKSTKPIEVTTPAIEEETVETLSSDELGLDVQLRSDDKAIRFTIANAKGISAVDYQISYTKELNGEDIPEGLIGQVDIAEGEEKIGINYREFGTCSSGTCRYDKVISPITLTLKIIKDGKTYSTEETIEL